MGHNLDLELYNWNIENYESQAKEWQLIEAIAIKKSRTSFLMKLVGEPIITEATPISSFPPMSPSIPPPSIFTTTTQVHTKNPLVSSTVSTHCIIHILDDPPEQVQYTTVYEEVFDQQNGRAIHESTSNPPLPAHTQATSLVHVDPFSILASFNATPLMNIVPQVSQSPGPLDKGLKIVSSHQPDENLET